MSMRELDRSKTLQRAVDRMSRIGQAAERLGIGCGQARFWQSDTKGEAIRSQRGRGSGLRQAWKAEQRELEATAWRPCDPHYLTTASPVASWSNRRASRREMLDTRVDQATNWSGRTSTHLAS